MSANPELSVALVDPASSVPFYVDRLARGLVSSGVATRVCCAPFFRHPLPEPCDYRRELVFAPWLGTRWLSALSHARATRRAGRALGYVPDWLRLERRLRRDGVGLVHLQWSLDARIDAWWLRRLRRRGLGVVVTLHNSGRRSDAPGRSGGESRLLEAAHAGIVLAATVARGVHGLAAESRQRLVVIPPSVPPAPPRLAPAEARERWRLPQESPVALFFGLVRPYKGVDLLLEAFARTAREIGAARLVIAGESPSGSAALLERAAALGIGERLLRVDRFLDAAEVSQLFAASDLVVLPYREGSASAVLLEAWRHERFPLVSAVGALAEQVTDGETGRLLPVGDLAALAEELSHWLARRPAALAAGERAAALARARFRPEAETAAHLAVYREIAVRSRAA